MAAKTGGKKQCTTCGKSGGVMICDGCQQSFCGKHSIEHRQQLTHQLDEIIQEHDLLQEGLGKLSANNSLLNQIDTWEKESIKKIQAAAELAREDLRKILEVSTKNIAKACHDIVISIRTSREADDFSESDINEWTKKLNELKLEIFSPSSIKITENKNSVIPLLTITNSSSTRKSASIDKIERFSEVVGEVLLENEGLVAKYFNTKEDYGYVFGQRVYSSDRHMIRFLVRFNKSFGMSLGCISSKAKRNTFNIWDLFSTGSLFYNDGILLHTTGYNGMLVEINDILCLTLECEKYQIELFHERRNETHILSIDPNQTPLPWQLLVVLTKSDDCVTILPDA